MIFIETNLLKYLILFVPQQILNCCVPRIISCLIFQLLGGRRYYHLLVFSPFAQRRQWHPTPVGKPHGWRSLVGCRLWGRAESDTTEATQQQRQPFCFFPTLPCVPCINLLSLYSLQQFLGLLGCYLSFNYSGVSFQSAFYNEIFGLILLHSSTASQLTTTLLILSDPATPQIAPDL